VVNALDLISDNGQTMNTDFLGRDELLRQAAEMRKIVSSAVRMAQEENRRRGIPNWYSINGHIVSDIEIAQLAAQRTTASNGKAAVANHTSVGE
jgi:hypothetical protein